MKRIFFILLFLSVGTTPLMEIWGQEVPPVPSTPGLIFIPPPVPQPLLDTTNPPPKTKEIKAKEFDLEIQTPPGTKVTVPLASKGESNAFATDFRFHIPTVIKRVKVQIEGPFGGKLIREINPEEMTGPLKISEKRIEDPSPEPDPNTLEALPQICPRLINESEWAQRESNTASDRNNLLPENAVYDGRKDLFSFADRGTRNQLNLESARMTFDSEDSSILVGVDPKTGKTAFESGGGFYSNLHYIVLPYSYAMEELYRNMELNFISLLKLERDLRETHGNTSEKTRLIEKMKPFYWALNGKGDQIGPYQLLMHYAFSTLKLIGREDLNQTWGHPLAHGFIPGPFLGSQHWGYSLCEWGDTSNQVPLQKMQYKNFSLWPWKSESPEEKIIVLVIEGDDQLNENPARRDLLQKGFLRPTDYTDDLIGFFVISRRDTAQGQTFSSPLQDFSIQVKTR